MNNFVCTKSHTGSKFSKSLWDFYAHDGLQLCYIAVFSAASDGATANRQILCRIFTSLMKDSVGQLWIDFDAHSAIC